MCRLPRSRAEAVQEAIRLFEEHEGGCAHVGIVMVRQLLDFVYGGMPNSPDEMLTKAKVQAYVTPEKNRKGVTGGISSAGE